MFVRTFQTFYPHNCADSLVNFFQIILKGCSDISRSITSSLKWIGMATKAYFLAVLNANLCPFHVSLSHIISVGV